MFNLAVKFGKPKENSLKSLYNIQQKIYFLFQITVLLSIVIALGAVSKLVKSEAAWIAYHVGQGLQGIFVAMLVTCNCQVLKLYTRTMKSKASRHIPIYAGKASSGSPLSKSTSLQLLTWEPTPDPV